jgi:hypothetical protein
MTHISGRLKVHARCLPGIIVLALLPGPAFAGAIACVRCTGPDVIYRCEATGDDVKAGDSVGLFCASRIAGDHAHASCAALRGIRDCDGVAASYAYQAEGVPGAPDGADPSGPKVVDKKEPATLTEFTKDTVEGSANAMKKAGENIGDAASKAGKATTDAIKGAGAAIGNATKKTLKCLGSALNDC